MCGKTGALVPSETVAYQVNKDVADITWPQEIFSLCMDESCEMAYFSADYGYLFFLRDIKASLDHKVDSRIKYVCYCQNITYDQVTKAVIEEGIREVRTFFRNRKPLIMAECRKKNPFGCSCMPDIQKHMDDLMKGN